MKVDVIGGGPAGLYFAILAKKAWPQLQLTVYERNRPDDTFGFGVVFSDETLETFEKYDRESYRAITDNFAYWDDIEIHFKGTEYRIGGNGFCGCSRVTLLRLLQERARALGVEMKFQTEVDPAEHRDADLIVAADGINSRIRASTPTRSSRARTCGATSSPGWARPGRSTPSRSSSARPSTASSSRIATSTSRASRPGCWRPIPETVRARRARQARRGAVGALPRRRVRQGARRPQAHHQPLALAQLPDHPLRALDPRQHRADRRRQGDAHFSIGSGTKLAMEDAIALYEAFPGNLRRQVYAACASKSWT
jgi:anthraniloyl-CoA monooxygenase